MSDKPVVAAFDFDVTITTKDTFLPFLYWAFGRKRVFSVLLKLFPDAAKVVLKLASRDDFKEKIVAELFTGKPAKHFKILGDGYASSFSPIIRPKARARIKWHLEQGHRLVMVSASLNLYLEKIAHDLGFNDLLCTTLEEQNGVFTGKLMGGNCRCQAKVDRLQQLLGDLTQYEIYAYGDSEGDKQMLEIADHSFYRHFA